MNLGSKITLCVSLIVLAILAVGNWLVWNRLGSWDLQRAHLLLGAWTMGGVAFAVYFAVRYLTRPLTELITLATQLGAGQLDRRVGEGAQDEIGRLGQALDRMAASLQAATDNLESQVAARTADLERSQAQLLQAAKLAAVGELAAGVAHEINNPAGTILMRVAQLVPVLEGGPPQATEDLEVIRRQVEKISRIVSGLVTFSRRTESGAAMVPLDVNEVVERTAQLMDGLLRSRHVVVERRLTPGLGRVRADGSRLEQVLLNLVNNAVDAMPDGGRLCFGSARGEGTHAGRVAICVEDSGSGIPPELIDRIFDPFFTTKEPGQGTGLGLSVSYAIVEQHGGTIEAASEPGRGSRFTVYLPTAEPFVEALAEKAHGG